ncbi:nucleotidyltransferase family protein [Microbacterium keratanolyticum]
MEVARFDVAASTALAHARTAHLGRVNGIRVLSIKGPVADHYRLRPPRVASDADVWVEPERHREFCLLLEAEGWHQRALREEPSLIGLHSVTYIHDEWGCDIDVHHDFPGFFAEGGAAFERIWRDRRELAIAGTAVTAPSRAGASVITALHGLRNVNIDRHRQEYESVVKALSVASDEERAELYALACDGGATWVLRDLLERTGIGAVRDGEMTDDQRRRWELHRTLGSQGMGVTWWVHARSLPWHRRPAFVARAVWVRRVEIPRNDAAIIPTRAEAWRFQTARWARVVRALTRHLLRRR